MSLTLARAIGQSDTTFRMTMELWSMPPSPADVTSASTATTAGAREHARAQAGAHADAMRTVPATAATDLPDGVEPETVVWDETVAGGGYAHRVLARGTSIHLVDLEGDACANLVLFDALDPSERLNVADTVKVQWQAYLGRGSLLLSDRGRVLASIVADTSGTRRALRVVEPPPQRGALRRRRAGQHHAIGAGPVHPGAGQARPRPSRPAAEPVALQGRPDPRRRRPAVPRRRRGGCDGDPAVRGPPAGDGGQHRAPGRSPGRLHGLPPAHHRLDRAPDRTR